MAVGSALAATRQTGLWWLHMLRKRLTPRQFALRDEAFERAGRWLHRVREHGGIAAPVIVTFQNRKLPPRHRDARIDIEVRRGTAFGRGILSS